MKKNFEYRFWARWIFELMVGLEVSMIDHNETHTSCRSCLTKNAYSSNDQAYETIYRGGPNHISELKNSSYLSNNIEANTAIPKLPLLLQPIQRKAK
jgi:hypothetical protein